MKRFVAGFLFVVSTMQAFAACTQQGKIEHLMPRDGGWVHVKMEGVTNMDLNSCGAAGPEGLMLNFNDTGGTPQGKEMMYSTLLAAFFAGKTLQLCSSACDTQHTQYSRLDTINYVR